MVVLRSVAKTDTLEKQRQIINLLASDLYELTGGTGSSSFSNLRLADGTKEAPSLAFASEPRTGLYKADNKLTFVNTAKKIFDIDNTSINSLRDLNFFKSQINLSSVVNKGASYYSGTYEEVPLVGGSGDSAIATITVSDYEVRTTTSGAGYQNGIFGVSFINEATETYPVSLVETVPANPSTFSPPEFEYQINGSNANINLIRGNTYIFDIGQTPGPVYAASDTSTPDPTRTAGSYSNVSTTGGSGTGATFDIVVAADGTTTVDINTAGNGYINGEDLNIPASSIGGTGTGLTVNISVLGIGTQPFHFEVDGETYLNPSLIVSARFGNWGEPGSIIQLIIKPAFPTSSVINLVRDTAQAIVNEIDFPVIEGAAGSYGSGAVLNAEFVNGAVSELDIDQYGVDYQVGDILKIYSNDIAFNSSNITTEFSSIISDFGVITGTTITSTGNGYEPNDILGVSLSELPLRSFWQLYLRDHYQFVFDRPQSPYYWNVGDTVSYSISTPTIVRTINGTAETSGVGSLSIVSSGTGHIDGTYVVSPTSTDGSGYQFVMTLTVSGGTYTAADITITSPGIDYEIGDTLTFLGFNVGSNVGPVLNVVDTSTPDPTRTPSINSGVSGTSSGTGSGATFNINVSADGTAVITIVNQGSGYTTGDIITIPVSSTGGTGSPFTLEVTAFTDLVLQVDSLQEVTPLSSVVGSHPTTITYGLAERLVSAVDSLVSPEVTELNVSKQYYLNDGVFPTYTLSVTNNASTNFVFTGQDSTTTHAAANDPVIRADRGDVLVFNVNASGHPFWILNSFDGSTFEQANATAIVQNNGAQVGAVTFDTSEVTVGTYYYVCANHPSAMFGTIVVGEESNDFFIENVELKQNRRYYFDVSNATNTGYDFVFKSSPSATTKLEADYITYDYANDRVIIQPDENTPETLYFSAEVGGSLQDPDNVGGFSGDAYTFTLNGSEEFSGSGYELRVNSVTRSETVNIEVDQGDITADNSVTTSTLTASTGSFSSELTADLLNIQDSNVTVSGNNDLSITTSSLNDIILTTRKLTVGGFNVLATGELETDQSVTITDASTVLSGASSLLSVNQQLVLQNNIISTTGNLNVVVDPGGTGLVVINAVSGLTIPAGSTLDRPNELQRSAGTIRFNTTTSQYEGYVASTSSWSSLGGIRDQDGNTYILAEASPGANDNTLYFYNDNLNTIRVTRNALNFWDMKKISSPNTSAVSFVPWTENTPVTAGSYIAYRNNIYSVTTAGTTDDPSNPPTHISGTVANGTAQLTWYDLSVADLTFDGINSVKLGPFGDIPLVISEDLKLFQNEISTLVNDLSLAPVDGKKVVITATTSLVIPSGGTLDRGIPAQGSIRFNITDNQFEGYNGTQWQGLGGVVDVNQDTKIIPELSPGSNEDTLYFYNNGSNTLRLTATELTFDTIDTVQTISTAFNLNVNTLSIDGSNVVLTSDGTTTKLTTAADTLEFAISTGINADTILRLNDLGNLLYNNNFGTGTPNYITVLKNDLTEFRLRDFGFSTVDAQLIKGTTDFLPLTVYTPSVTFGAKIVISAENTNTNDREVIEYTVTNKGTDISYTEFGKIFTGVELFTSEFSIDANNGNIVVTPSLTDDVSANDVVNITAVITQLRK
jgi:plastocyanin